MDPLVRACAFAKFLEKGDTLDPPMIHIMGDKFYRGGDEVGATLNVEEAFLIQHRGYDGHFTQYIHPLGQRLCKNHQDPKGIKFGIAAFDLDFDSHRSKPTNVDFVNVCRVAYVVDFVPNIVYQTRGGARFVYFIDPIEDPEEFEGHYQALLGRLMCINNSSCRYQVDSATKDWPRLFRLPLVTRDDREEFNYDIRFFHTDRLDIRNFKVKKKTIVYTEHAGTDVYTGSDKRFRQYLADLEVEGQRNRELFKAAAYVVSKYRIADHDQLLGIVGAKAGASGLSEKEIRQTIESATKYINRKASR